MSLPSAPAALPTIEETRTRRVGEAVRPSPLLNESGRQFVSHESRILIPSREEELRDLREKELPIPSFEASGAREKIFYNPDSLKCGIVTCGGLCPGLNNVIRALVRSLHASYGVQDILGFRYGYGGLGAAPLEPPVELTLAAVEDIHRFGGTLLGSCRGGPPVKEMVDSLVRLGIDILFTIGGDGTLRGAGAIADEVRKRKLPIAIVAIPKTIDNDLRWVERSFGFTTAVNQASSAVIGAHEEARGAWNGIGLVKLMGRHSGFIAAHTTLSNQEVNFCLIPEVAFDLEGPRGFYQALERRLARKHHAVIVVAEGAGQELIDPGGKDPGKDASGNVRLKDVGLFLKAGISKHLERAGVDHTLKYIDPSYMVRSLPAGTMDSELCATFAHHAVHAAMCGKTNVYIGSNHSHFVDVPIPLGFQTRKKVDPNSDGWRRIIESTSQPASMRN